MKWILSLLLLAGIGVGIYFGYIVFDPLSLVTIALLLQSNNVNILRQQQIAETQVKHTQGIVDNQRKMYKILEDLKRRGKK